MKTCIKCNIEKPLDSFYSHQKMASGKSSKCKECTCADVRANRNAKREYYLQYDRNRPNKIERASKVVEYQKTGRGKAVRQLACQNYFEKWPGKRAANYSVSNALRDGRMARPDYCSSCGCSCKPEAHHCDYTRPLDVTWLCVGCRKQWHRDNKPIYQIAA